MLLEQSIVHHHWNRLIRIVTVIIKFTHENSNYHENGTHPQQKAHYSYNIREASSQFLLKTKNW